VLGLPDTGRDADHLDLSLYLLLGGCKEAEMSSEEALRTAVILPDEHLLIPVLNAIPEQIPSGYGRRNKRPYYPDRLPYRIHNPNRNPLSSASATGLILFRLP